MTTDFKIAVVTFFAVVFVAALLTGCSAPMVEITRIYHVNMYGAEDNRVAVEVLKEQDINPQVKASLK